MESKGKRRIRSFRVETGDMTYEARVSLLMLLQAKQREKRKKSLLHRLIFLARVTPELVNKRDPGGYYENFLQKLQRCHQEGITGLLLLYPNYVIHVLESSSDVLYSVIQDLRDMQQQQEKTLLLEPKILVVSHNIPSRLFQNWEYALLNITAKRLDDTLKGEPIEKIISECLTVLLKLGAHIQKAYKELPNKQANPVLDHVPELIVPQDLIQRLLKSKELLTPAQFLCIYNASLSIILDSELVWPMPEHLLPESRK
ncbi:testis-expressed protein 47-like isoform X1 [Scyliorhinus canicula]|uniref:testis-expressed protein 47-like isoform X1 n=1 Tax=Scyliorhinus canicula TaxID=7830 RepID=UPI0018F30E49|nr:testis-expressed protein 47-like isoform X1 [Scyliorhinus canicula]